VKNDRGRRPQLLQRPEHSPRIAYIVLAVSFVAEHLAAAGSRQVRGEAWHHH
jgi:hypothetical protein